MCRHGSQVVAHSLVGTVMVGRGSKQEELPGPAAPGPMRCDAHLQHDHLPVHVAVAQHLLGCEALGRVGVQQLPDQVQQLHPLVLVDVAQLPLAGHSHPVLLHKLAPLRRLRSSGGTGHAAGWKQWHGSSGSSTWQQRAQTLAGQLVGMLQATLVAQLPLAGHSAATDNCRLHSWGCSCQPAGKVK